MTSLRSKLRYRNALAQLHARVAVPEIVRVEMRDAGRLAGASDDVLRHVGREAGEDAPLRSAVVLRRADPSA
jgi:hypothetical protein